MQSDVQILVVMDQLCALFFSYTLVNHLYHSKPQLSTRPRRPFRNLTNNTSNSLVGNIFSSSAGITVSSKNVDTFATDTSTGHSNTITHRLIDQPNTISSTPCPRGEYFKILNKNICFVSFLYSMSYILCPLQIIL